jgi:hypothetical protein
LIVKEAWDGVKTWIPPTAAGVLPQLLVAIIWKIKASLAKPGGWPGLPQEDLV